MSTTLADLDTLMHERGYQPYMWEMRGDDVYVRHIVSGGIDNPVYGWNRVGTIDETEQMIRAFPKREAPTPGYCNHCQVYSSNMNIHICR